jgi:enamine deaminase RidA (YjgF/YER057c/UK114 family)
LQADRQAEVVAQTGAAGGKSNYMSIRGFIATGAITLGTFVLLSGQTPGGQGFSSPQAAVKALVNATKNSDVDSVLKILGPSAREIVITNDPVADDNNRKAFVEKANEKVHVVSDRDQPSRMIVEVGASSWPLPIPLVKMNGKWYFDPEQGKTEILLRRIGDNELTAINVSQGFVEAQFEYAEEDPAKTGHHLYAQKLISTPGTRDGLYWKSDDPKDESPIGDLVAHALAEGYTDKTEPYHGYYFKILKSQGQHAPGGAMSYLENGVMAKGFAVLAWPSEYKVTGVMTFQIDRSGILFEKDLGDKTADIAGAITAYDPDKTWTPVSNSAGS